MQKPRSWKKWAIGGGIVLLAAGLIYSGMNRSKAPQYETILAQRGDLTQVVSVTGNVKATQNLDLAFVATGRADQVPADVGDQVKAGDVLATLDSSTLKAQLRQAQAGIQAAQAQMSQIEAGLETQQAKLDELKAGTRVEEIQVAQTAVYNADQAWNDAKTNLANVKAKAQVDLSNVYQTALNELPKAITIGKTALYTLTDIQYAHFSIYDQDSSTVANAKQDAVNALLGATNAGRWTNVSLYPLTGGAYGKVITAQTIPSPDNTDAAIVSVLDALTQTKAALDVVPLTTQVSTADRTTLDTAKSSLTAEIITLSAEKQAIDEQKAGNANLVTAAETQENSAKNALASARDQLTLEQAGPTPEQLRQQEAVVKQAQANIESQKAMIAQAAASAQAIQSQIDQTVLRAPIDGVITRQDIKVGEIVPPDVNLVSMISESNYEIDSDIAEVDIAKIKLGDTATVTLDAYGSTVEFQATVTKIDPAETVIEGVPTYKTTLEFTKPDPRIKSGMTANIDILTDSRKNVIVVPQRAVIVSGADRTIRLLVSGPNPSDPSETIETLKEVPVQVGIRGVDGNVEIVSGLKEGDKVVTGTQSP
jgi:HlyD family secretion protein